MNNIKTEKDLENAINSITKKFKNKEISKKKLLQQQIKTVEYGLKNVKLSTIKKMKLKQAIHLFKITEKML